MLSRTASSMALFRAIESTRPPKSRLFNDALAIHCLPWYLRSVVQASRYQLVRDLVCYLIDWRYPGARTSGASRTRVIDDWIVSYANKGAKQVLILGCGYDARAVRLPELNGLKIYELDRTEVIQQKEKFRTATFPNIRAQRQTISIDFLRDNLREVLTQTDFDTSEPTVVVWEGVTNYLDTKSVEQTLQTLARCCATGSHLIFTYVEEAILGEDNHGSDVARLRNRLACWGESWTFGIDPRNTAGFVSRFGYSLLVDLGATDYRRCAYGSRASDLTGYEFYRLATCIMGPNPQGKA